MALDPSRTTRILYTNRRLVASVQDVGNVALTYAQEEAKTDNTPVGNPEGNVVISMDGFNPIQVPLRYWPALRAEIDQLLTEAGINLPSYQARANRGGGGGAA